MIKENALKEGWVKNIQDSAKSSESNLTVKVTEKIENVETGKKAICVDFRHRAT